MLYRQSLLAGLTRAILKRAESVPYEFRLMHDAVDRPFYGFCVLRAAQLAKKLGHTSVSALEFGVAGGNGLVSLEYHAAHARKIVPIDIEIYGFDTGKGLPAPKDYRDLPYHWEGGSFEMDEAALRARLKESKLVLGDVADTVRGFAATHQPAPIGAMMFDLDYYSSTRAALEIFDAARDVILPRAFLYFDDVLGNERSAYTHYTGVLGAIRDFNLEHEDQKICPLNDYVAKGLAECLRHVYVYHDFKHPDYCRFVGTPNEQLPLA